MLFCYYAGGNVVAIFSCDVFLTDEEREQVERLRWPSRGYLQELNEYQQRRRQIRKSRCSIMWPLLDALRTGREGEKQKMQIGDSFKYRMKETFVWLVDSDVLYSHKLWPLTLWYKADSCDFSLVDPMRRCSFMWIMLSNDYAWLVQ